MKMLILALLVSFSASASELETLLARLEADDFDVRETATLELGQYPTEYAKKFLDMSRSAKDSEIAYRLLVASRLVFENTIMISDPRWLRLYGTLEADGDMHWVYVQQQPEAEVYGYNVSGILINFIVTDGVSDNKLYAWDFVVAINGKQEFNPMPIEAGKEYEVTVHRYSDVEKIKTDGLNSNSNLEFKELKVKITAGWKEERFVDQSAKENVREITWREYLIANPPAEQK